jgi:hypothetical protein
MQYPLSEKIGDPDLFVGREKEFRLLNKWLKNIPKRLSKSRVILARRKSGKTAIVQRIFNQVWSENGLVIPLKTVKLPSIPLKSPSKIDTVKLFGKASTS